MRAFVVFVLPIVVAMGLFATMQLSAPFTALASVPGNAVFGGPVMSECKSCHGSDWCQLCGGTGARDGNVHKSCHGCGGTGSCQDCLEPHPLVLIPGGKS
ncbi:MAG TPA: hypothetical protein VFA63_08745 [Pseudonocardiaceae bacterium]|nr:hypothetical protein [Pseudonocardiaceae bacterium]